MASQTATQGGLERIAKIPITINGKQIDVTLPEENNRYFKLRPIGPTQEGYRYIVVVYRGPVDPNGYKDFGREEQAVQPNQIYRLADGLKQLHFCNKQ